MGSQKLPAGCTLQQDRSVPINCSLMSTELRLLFPLGGGGGWLGPRLAWLCAGTGLAAPAGQAVALGTRWAGGRHSTRVGVGALDGLISSWLDTQAL